MDREELRDVLRARRDRLVISGRELAAERERGMAKGYLGPLESAAMRRGVLHIETEVRWHDEFDALLAAGAPLGGDAARRGRVAREARSGTASQTDETDENAPGRPSSEGVRHQGQAGHGEKHLNEIEILLDNVTI
jgi:hypothetical protein